MLLSNFSDKNYGQFFIVRILIQNGSFLWASLADILQVWLTLIRGKEWEEPKEQQSAQEATFPWINV